MNNIDQLHILMEYNQLNYQLIIENFHHLVMKIFYLMIVQVNVGFEEFDMNRNLIKKDKIRKKDSIKKPMKQTCLLILMMLLNFLNRWSTKFLYIKI